MIFMLFKPLGKALLICVDLFTPSAQGNLCLMLQLLLTSLGMCGYLTVK